jgi:hypothetical protein
MEEIGLDPSDEDQRRVAFAMLAFFGLPLYTVKLTAKTRRPKDKFKPRGSKADWAVIERAYALEKEGMTFDEALPIAIKAAPNLLKHADRTTHTKRIRRLKQHADLRAELVRLQHELQKAIAEAEGGTK